MKMLIETLIFVCTATRTYYDSAGYQRHETTTHRSPGGNGGAAGRSGFA